MAVAHMPGTAVAYSQVRRWKRFQVDLRLKITCNRTGDKLMVFGQGSDVSEGGMAGYIPAELNNGDVVDLELMLPYSASKEPIKVKATVRNRNGFRYGLEYLPMTDAVREALLRSLKT